MKISQLKQAIEFYQYYQFLGSELECVPQYNATDRAIAQKSKKDLNAKKTVLIYPV